MRLLSVICGTSLLVNALFCFYFVRDRKLDSLTSNNGGTSVERTVHRLAVLKPVSVKVLDTVVTGFRDTLAKVSGIQFEIDEYDANGDQGRMRSQVEAILNGSYDLVFTIGASCTMMARERIAREKTNLPMVFSSVRSDGLEGIIRGDGADPTGIVEGEDPEAHATLLLSTKPDARRVLIVFSPATAGMEGQAQRLGSVLEERGVEVGHLPIFSLADVQEKVASEIREGWDLVVTLPDPITTSAEEHLVKLCDQHHVALCAPNFEAVEAGAVMGFGERGYRHGVKAAQMALSIVKDGKRPEDIPVVDAAADYTLLINREKLKSQNVPLSHDLQLLIERAQFLN